MSTSIWGGYKLWDKTYAAANRGADTLHTLVMANNALHLADEAAQVRVAFSGRTGSYMSSSGSLADTWYRVASPFVFPLTVAHTGVPYPLRVAIAGVRNIGGSTEARYKFVLTPEVRRSGSEQFEAGAHVATFTNATGVASWFGFGLLQMSLGAAMGGRVQFPDVGGGTTTSEAVLARLTVFAQSDAAEDPPITVGIYAAEYVGS